MSKLLSHKGVMRVSLATMLLATTLAFAAPADRWSEQLDMVEDLLVGTFDSYEQAYWQEVLNVPAEYRHRRLTAIYRKVDVPAFAGDTYYAHKYWDGDPAKPAYRNLYVLRGDDTVNKVRLRLLTIPHPERLDNALNDPSVLRNLTPDVMGSMPPPCDSVWEPRGTVFHITLAGEDCWLTDVHTSGVPVNTKSDATLDQDMFYFHAFGWGKDGKLLYGKPDLVGPKQRRARWFDCTIATPGSKATVVKLHDQGDAVTIPGAGSTQGMTIRLRQVTPPYAVRSRELALLVLPAGATERVSDAYELLDPHASTDPAADSIGYESSAVQVACKRT